MKRPFSIIAILVVLSGCTSSPLTGTWQYDGGIYNEKSRAAAPDFRMQRTYSSDSYEAHVLEGNADPKKYAAGNYQIKNDSLYLTGTFSNQPSQLTGRTQVYQFTIADDKLTIKGVLPNGMQVEEYWIKLH
ncbi:MAG TPA: lipoprotein [Sphingobacteriaceae bacterium]